MENVIEKKPYLQWRPIKTVTINGVKTRVSIEASLDDFCKNGVCDFSLTCLVEEQQKNGSWIETGCGADLELIARVEPELKPFINLHCCNRRGQPTHAVANGMYFFEHSDQCSPRKYLRLTSDEEDALRVVSLTKDKSYFAVMLEKLGVLDRWQQEADKFISFLEEKTCTKWENPYEESNEKFTVFTSDEEKAKIEARTKSGYFSESKIRKRNEDEQKKIREKARNELIDDYNKKIEKAKLELAVYLFVFDNGVSIENLIFYSHKNEAVFNWKSFGNKVSKEDFERLMKCEGKPEGVTFKLGE